MTVPSTFLQAILLIGELNTFVRFSLKSTHTKRKRMLQPFSVEIILYPLETKSLTLGVNGSLLHLFINTLLSIFIPDKDLEFGHQ